MRFNMPDIYIDMDMEAFCLQGASPKAIEFIQRLAGIECGTTAEFPMSKANEVFALVDAEEFYTMTWGGAGIR